MDRQTDRQTHSHPWTLQEQVSLKSCHRPSSCPGLDLPRLLPRIGTLGWGGKDGNQTRSSREAGSPSPPAQAGSQGVWCPAVPSSLTGVTPHQLWDRTGSELEVEHLRGQGYLSARSQLALILTCSLGSPANKELCNEHLLSWPLLSFTGKPSRRHRKILMSQTHGGLQGPTAGQTSSGPCHLPLLTGPYEAEMLSICCTS